MSPVIPLHTYQSPNGQGLCTYEIDGMACGNAEKYVVHVRTGCGVFAPVTDATLAPLVPGQGMPKDRVSAYLEEKADMAHETYHGAVFPVDSPPTTAQVVAMFHDQALRLAVEKNAAYGDAWRRQGYIGNVARILSKVDRLRNMVWRDQSTDLPPEVAAPTEQEEETLRDTLLDLANICAFAAHNLTQGNRWGGDRG